MKSIRTSQRTIILLPFLVLLIMLQGCGKEWLEVKPDKSQAVPSKLSDYRAMLRNTAVMNANCISLGEIASDGHYVVDATFNTGDIAPKNAYTWSQLAPYPSYEGYTKTYERIFQLNYILEGLAKLEINTAVQEREREQLKAQVLFTKAITYYWLAQIYGQPYKAATAATDQGILVQDNTEFLNNVRRVTVAETYALILGYLNEAMPDLPVSAEHVTQASKPAGEALLARVYLTMQQYADALTHANACLQMKNTLIQYSTLPSAGYIGSFNAEVIYHEDMSNSQVTPFTNAALIDNAFYNSYNANDLRKARFFMFSGPTTTFIGNYNNNNFLLFCGLATDEVYLIRAESYARTGNVAAAMQDLNDLLRSRWRKNPDGSTMYIDQTAADAPTALQLILAERKKELIMRGLRWGDLRRLNQQPETQVTLTRTIAGNTYTLEPGSYRYTFPLPTPVLDLSGQAQTTGWQ
ncbi:RagB/SusD family nutrient uptake outer membrane protein [Pedobacter sp. MC2016-14]|uniref:RagB/SusD family nutrient uptake outer membrane protein n=1 Tax=Pedobacter sp. MC2016-14 TaxID=2897327 RepID=UPI001E2FD3B9|nr:RagB/SusD family nutrient uptake outer membrane protein [Pedobacter sp. MC2016-14]MCD0489206.1 RagB/SusD family nutrient uptake outer membrane protein [Pedobacter sp. MC2016-14]